jgi:hypothetical protein
MPTTKRAPWTRSEHAQAPLSEPTLRIGPLETRSIGRALAGTRASAPVWSEIAKARARPGDRSMLLDAARSGAGSRLHGSGVRACATASAPALLAHPASPPRPLQLDDARAESAGATASQRRLFSLPRAEVRVLKGGRLLRLTHVASAPSCLYDDSVFDARAAPHAGGGGNLLDALTRRTQHQSARPPSPLSRGAAPRELARKALELDSGVGSPFRAAGAGAPPAARRAAPDPLDSHPLTAVRCAGPWRDEGGAAARRTADSGRAHALGASPLPPPPPAEPRGRGGGGRGEV